MKHFSALLLTAIWCSNLVVIAQQPLKTDSLNVLINNTSSEKKKAELYIELSELHQSYDLKQALKDAKDGYVIASTLKDDELMADLNSLIGRQYINLGVYELGLKHSRIAYDYFVETKNFGKQFRSALNLGTLYFKLNDNDKSLSYFQDAYSLYILNPEIVTDKQHIGILLNNIGSIYDRLDQIDKSIEYFNKGLEEINYDGTAASNLYNNLGFIKLEQGDTLEAYNFFKASLKIRQQANDVHGIAKSYLYLSYFFRDANSKKDSSRYYIDKAIKLAKSAGLLEVQQHSYSVLSSLDEMENNYASALAHYKTFKTLSDSILNKQKISQLSNLQTGFAMEKYDQEALAEKQALTLKYTLYIIILSFIILLSIALTVLLKAQKNKVQLEKENLELDVELKNKELTTNVMYLVRKNELINSVAKKLLTLKEKLKSENLPIVKSAIFDLQSEVDNEVWKEFELRFQQVHTTFYENLRKAHPDLSPSEERLAAFLRLNLNTKEIASITHQSPRGVDVARGRLRKKLNLTNTDTNLVNYLSGM